MMGDGLLSFLPTPPIQIQFCKFVSWCPLLQGVGVPSLVMYFFSFYGHIQHCGLSIMELSYLVKPSHFNMSMSVTTIEQLSNNMFNNDESLMTIHVCEEQLSHFLVFLLISFQKLHNFKQIISKKIYGHWLEYFFFSIFKYAHHGIQSTHLPFYGKDCTILCVIG